MSALTELNAANNKLTTAHGLDGCISLKMADFSGNKLTRLGKMECITSSTSYRCQHCCLITVTISNFLGEITNCTTLQEIKLDSNRLVTIKVSYPTLNTDSSQ